VLVDLAFPFVIIAVLLPALWLSWSKLVPWRAAAPLGAVLAFIVGRLLGVRRAHVVSSMVRAGIARPELVADAMYHALGRGLIELLWVAARPSRRLDDLVELSDDLRRLLAHGRGLLVATAHTGNWDLLACAAAAHVPLTVVTKRLSIRWLDRLWQTLRARRGVRLVGVGQAARAAASALARGEALAMLIDQAPERRRGVVKVEFLGSPADVDLAPALLAMRARVPLALVLAARDANGRQRAELIALCEPPSIPSRSWAERSMQELTLALETFILHNPEQWLWMHRRWKSLGSPGPMRSPRERASAPCAF